MPIDAYEAMLKFRIRDAKRPEAEAELAAFIESFALLDEVDTEGVPPLWTVTDAGPLMRDDSPRPFLFDTKANRLSPYFIGGYYNAPGMLTV